MIFVRIMEKLSDTLFVIAARGGSKGLPGKNIRNLCGKPLIAYSIDIARAFVSDEAFKMSVTDAIGVAAKQLGIAADVYFANDRTKYTPIEDNSSSNQNTTKQKSTTNSSAKPSQENTHQSETPQAKEQTAEELAATPSEEVDKRLLRTNDNKMSKEQYEYLMSEIERTGSMADVVAYAKTEDLTTLSSGKCVALLTGLLKRPTKKS